MAKLHRFLKLNDRFDSQVFTFVLPGKVVTENNPDTYSKDIVYGYHKWTAYFIRTDVHLGCFLKLQSGCNGMRCQIDFSFTLLNREHFTRNETFIEKGCVFTTETNQHGRKTFVGLNDLVERDFLQVSGDFLIELEMRKINCSFECYIRIPRESQSRYTYESKLESSYFSYGLFDWSISLFPSEGTMQQDENIALQIHRHTSFDHICNVRYYVTLGENSAFQSEELDQLVDLAGNGDIYIVNGSMQQLTRGRSSLRMKVTMVSVVSLSEVTLNVASRSKSRAHLYDRDKQAWLMEADTTGKFLSFRLYYTDITHVPRKYSRYVCWNILVLTRYIPDHKVKTNYGPFSKYYVQQDLDDGHHIMTSIPVDALHDADCLYTEPDDPRITVHIEWVDSHLLCQPSYHFHDDIDKLQKHQMRREILALQSENLVLEKQLHSYQQSLAKVTDKGKEIEKETEKKDADTKPANFSAKQQKTDISRDPTKDLTREALRESVSSAVQITRDLPRDAHSETQLNAQRQTSRESTRDMPRETQRDLPRDAQLENVIQSPRPSSRGSSRDLSRDSQPRDAQYDNTMPSQRPASRDSSRDLSRESRYNERTPLTATERKSYKEENGYASDKTSGYYSDKTTGYSDRKDGTVLDKTSDYYNEKSRHDRPRNENRRSSRRESSTRDRDVSYERTSAERSSYGYR